MAHGAATRARDANASLVKELLTSTSEISVKPVSSSGGGLRVPVAVLASRCAGSSSPRLRRHPAIRNLIRETKSKPATISFLPLFVAKE